MWFTEESGQIGQVDLAEGVVEPPQRSDGRDRQRIVCDAYRSSTLHATVNPNGTTVSDCHFEYGTSRSLWRRACRALRCPGR